MNDFKIIESNTEFYIVQYADGTTRKRYRLPGPAPKKKTITEEINDHRWSRL